MYAVKDMMVALLITPKRISINNECMRFFIDISEVIPVVHMHGEQNSRGNL